MDDEVVNPDAPEDKAVDILLRWSESSDSSPDNRGDSFEGIDEDESSALAEQQVLQPDPPTAVSSEESFRSAEELHQRIEDALRRMSHLPAAPVHRQVSDIRAALLSGDIDPSRGKLLIEEVQSFIETQIAVRSDLPPAEHPEIQRARSLTTDALLAYGEASRLCGEFIDTQDASMLDLSGALLGRAAEFLLAAKTALIDARPDEEQEAGAS
jgi:hypothetical protein